VLACLKFTRTLERLNPCAVVRLVNGFSDCLRDYEAGVRMGALSVLKTMAERTGKRHCLMAKSMLEALRAGLHNESDGERAMIILCMCKDLDQLFQCC
jgi:hypothetical protein